MCSRSLTREARVPGVVRKTAGILLLSVCETTVRFNQLERPDFRKGRLPDNSLDAAVHESGVGDDLLDLLFPFCPGLSEGAFFGFEIGLHGDKRFHDRFNFLTEFGPDQVLVNELHLAGLAVCC